MLARLITFITLGIAAVAVALVPGSASAAIGQPPGQASVGTAYSYQVSDPVSGKPVTAQAYTEPGFALCGPAEAIPGLPPGLSVSSTGLISGVPLSVGEFSTCLFFTFADGSFQKIVLTIVVGTGNAAVDAVLDPAVVSLQGGVHSVLPPGCDPRYVRCFLGLFTY